ncbi:MAG TPA: hypothetical protein VFZ16_23450 [Hyphomicrobiaceae bacterium]|nr:hypothetical protein [Hyphomicrobiaceae bacterium]
MRVGWLTILAAAVLAGVLLLLGGVDSLPDQEFAALGNVVILVAFGSAWLGIYRVLHGGRPWQRAVQAWLGRPMTHWNDSRVIVLLAGIAFGFQFLDSVDLPPGDRWSSASVLVLLAVCLGVQMINVAFFRRRDRK